MLYLPAISLCAQHGTAEHGGVSTAKYSQHSVRVGDLRPYAQVQSAPQASAAACSDLNLAEGDIKSRIVC
jgi:hypothetical protein